LTTKIELIGEIPKSAEGIARKENIGRAYLSPNDGLFRMGLKGKSKDTPYGRFIVEVETHDFTFE